MENKTIIPLHLMTFQVHEEMNKIFSEEYYPRVTSAINTASWVVQKWLDENASAGQFAVYTTEDVQTRQIFVYMIINQIRYTLFSLKLKLSQKTMNAKSWARYYDYKFTVEKIMLTNYIQPEAAEIDLEKFRISRISEERTQKYLYFDDMALLAATAKDLIKERRYGDAFNLYEEYRWQTRNGQPFDGSQWLEVFAATMDSIEFGYDYSGMFVMPAKLLKVLNEKLPQPVFALWPDGTESMIEDDEEEQRLIAEGKCLFGIEIWKYNNSKEELNGND